MSGAEPFADGREIFVKGKGSRGDECGDALRSFGVGDAFEEAVGGLQDGDGDFWAIEVWSEASAVTLARFAEEHSAYWRGGAEGLFDQARTFDSYRAGFGGEAAAKRDAKFLEPAAVAAGDDACLRWLDSRGHGVVELRQRREKINTERTENFPGNKIEAFVFGFCCAVFVQTLRIGEARG